MYHCYLRGRKNELLAIRDAISKIQQANITPIIEPISQNPNDLASCVRVAKDNGVNLIVVTNPQVQDGAITNNPMACQLVINSVLGEDENLELGIIINQAVSPQEINSIFDAYPNNIFSLIHMGQFYDPNILLNIIIQNKSRLSKNIFISGTVSKEYIDFLSDLPRILIHDGFNKLTTNSAYRELQNEFFSDLHDTYDKLGFQGFGDFSVTGDFFSKGGGQPKTVAVHLTYTQPNDQKVIFVRHFLSEDRDYREDVAILVEEAFSDIHDFLTQRPDILSWSDACQAIEEHFNTTHNPGLGSLKRLSIRHHFELMHCLLTS